MRSSYPPNAGYHILNPGTEIVWGPFRARVSDLYHTDCQIQAEHDPMMRCIQLAFRWGHGARGDLPVYGISERIPCEAFEDRQRLGGYINQVRVHMNVAHNISFQISNPRDNTAWMPVRIGEAHGSPHGTFVNYNINDFIMWDGQDTEQTEQLIVQPDSVPELLARIKELQEPKAKELLKRERKEQGKLLTQAKILTFDRGA